MRVYDGLIALFGFVIVLACLEPPRADAVAWARGAGVACAIDNGQTDEHQIRTNQGGYENTNYSWWAWFECSLPAGPSYGLQTDDIDRIDIYIYDGSAAEFATAWLTSTD